MKIVFAPVINITIIGKSMITVAGLAALLVVLHYVFDIPKPSPPLQPVCNQQSVAGACETVRKSE